jgi:2-(1,2-epoxy-1,2-dihydrophenyl)acetyl-CoA isomerase
MAEISVTERAGYRIITLNRPEKLNATTAPMLRALRAAFEDAASDRDCRALVLTGAGRGFCAGQDLSAVNALGDPATADLGALVEELYNPLIQLMRSHPLPVVCAVNGIAAGAGANLALACDIVLAARSAAFVQAFARIALIPDAGGTWILPRLVGDARARALALLAEKISADQAAEWGMIWRVVEDDALIAEAEKLAAYLATQPTATLGLIKQALLASSRNDLATQLALERDLQREAGRSGDYAEGARAFLEKRPPRFSGRA